MSGTPRWYASRIDWRIAAALALGPLGCAGALIATIAAGEGVAVAAGVSALVAAIYLGLLFPMRYAVTDDAVVVRHGLVRRRIPLGAITEVRPTRNPSPAPSTAWRSASAPVSPGPP